MAPFSSYAGQRPVPPRIVIAHRGASGYRPEHTLAAYELAIKQGADYLEPDLVITRDGVLVARHENEISGTTNVAEVSRFANRKTTKTIDGQPVTGWFAEDFTLAELKSLRARERLPPLRPESARFDGRYPIATLEELIDLAQRRSKETGRTIGIYPETKHPSYFRSIGKPLEKPLADLLRRKEWDRPDAPVFVQSFEVDNLMELRQLTRVRLVQLLDDSGSPFDSAVRGLKITYADMMTPEGLRAIARYAQGIGPAKSLVIPVEQDRLGSPTPLVRNAHDAGLLVHCWTFRSENAFLPLKLRSGGATDAGYLARKGDARTELSAFWAAGVDGVFSDQPDDAVASRP